MEHDRDDEDPRLIRMLRAVKADADPALWTRVRARIEARPRVPALLAWAMRPAALAVSLALLVATSAMAVFLSAGSSVATGEDYATLTDALIAERDAEVGARESAPGPAKGAASDSGSGR
ncbi:MAG: hypothetical protein ACRENJ_11010 [Candidatus Eiseniibacteriota bacterium]